MPRGGGRNTIGLFNYIVFCHNLSTFSGWGCPGVSAPTQTQAEARDPGVSVRDVMPSLAQERPHHCMAVGGVSSMSTLTPRRMRR